jgi:hypothetical protein
MTMRAFLREFRDEIDEVIISVVGPDAKRNDHERELWVRNDESLYHMARRCGVRV